MQQRNNAVCVPSLPQVSYRLPVNCFLAIRYWLLKMVHTCYDFVTGKVYASVMCFVLFCFTGRETLSTHRLQLQILRNLVLSRGSIQSTLNAAPAVLCKLLFLQIKPFHKNILLILSCVNVNSRCNGNTG